jgi:UV DNA damage repair endonuclease
MEQFIIHGCEQVLRFTKAENWNDLPEQIKVQLGFNMGVVALGLSLSKEDGFLTLSNAREEKISMKEFNEHMKKLVEKHQVPVNHTQIAREF